MFVPVWLLFLATGTVMTVLVLVWALKTSQFEDQDRARYLPLVGLTPGELGAEPVPHRTLSKVGVFLVLLSGLVVLALTLVTVIRHP